MKRYRINTPEGGSCIVHCETPKVGALGHDLVCSNEQGETVAYFFSFTYWTDCPAVVVSDCFAAKCPPLMPVKPDHYEPPHSD